ncbi:uncharacterized protein LOC142348681 isoform X2 [Convolutriloba macropyga]|uniref:uncharacterized protein LOC142348681 isoform X2 n=1 Tax=Convolutriloba macropyga TaxID=536237 RepID=UPI003F51DB59
MYRSTKISAKPSAFITILFLSLPMQTVSEYEEYGWFEYEYFDYDVVNKTLVYMDIWSQTLHNITIKAEPSQFTCISEKLKVTHGSLPPEIPAGKSFLPMDLYIYGSEMQQISKGFKNVLRLHSITFERIEFVNSSIDPPEQITDLIRSFRDDLRYFKLQNITKNFNIVYDFTGTSFMTNLGGFKLRSVPDKVVLDHTILVPANDFVKNGKDKELGIYISNVEISTPMFKDIVFWFQKNLIDNEEVTILYWPISSPNQPTATFISPSTGTYNQTIILGSGCYLRRHLTKDTFQFIHTVERLCLDDNFESVEYGSLGIHKFIANQFATGYDVKVEECRFSNISTQVHLLWNEQNCGEIGERHNLIGLCKFCFMQFYQLHFASSRQIQAYCSGKKTIPPPVDVKYDSPVDNRTYYIATYMTRMGYEPRVRNELFKPIPEKTTTAWTTQSTSTTTTEQTTTSTLTTEITKCKITEEMTTSSTTQAPSTKQKASEISANSETPASSDAVTMVATSTATNALASSLNSLTTELPSVSGLKSTTANVRSDTSVSTSYSKRTDDFTAETVIVPAKIDGVNNKVEIQRKKIDPIQNANNNCTGKRYILLKSQANSLFTVFTSITLLVVARVSKLAL